MSYEPHPRCDTPDDATVVWRYTELAKFLDVLEHKRLWFSRLDLLDDRREGKLTSSEIKYLLEVGGSAAQNVELFNRESETSFVNCWYEGITESMAMWDLYGSPPDGVAIKSTIARLKNALSTTDHKVFIGRAKYVDWAQCYWENNVIATCVRKADSYKHESEVRLLIWLPEMRYGNVPSGLFSPAHMSQIMAVAFRDVSPYEPVSEEEMRRAVENAQNIWFRERQVEQLPPGVRIPSAPCAFIDEVVVGPKTPEWMFQLVTDIAMRYGISAVRKSELS